MSLDMYLSADLYLWNYKEEDKKLSDQIEKILDGLPPVSGSSFRESRIKSVGIDVMYWRKANAIHQWFVDNVQDGDDDCKRYFVEDDDLKVLLENCQEVLNIYNNPDLSNQEKESKIESILPTTDGFFFGSKEYDESYIADVRRTVEELTRFLNSDVSKRCDFYYQASW